ncbi:MAG: EAL domain-containing protein [Duganella sp.]
MWPDPQLYLHTSDALALLNDERIVDVNPAAVQLFGCAAPAHMLGYRLVDFSPLQQAPGVLSAPTLAALQQRAQQRGNVRFEWQCVRRDGRPLWVDVLMTAFERDDRRLLHVAMRETSGRQQQQFDIYMALMEQVAVRGRLAAHARHLAEHDFLTNLPNRVLLLDRLRLALAAARRNRRQRRMVAILFIDLDRFKLINDTLGHQVGDLLLREVAERLVGCVRGVDTVSRQGGDEFVVVLADIGGIDQAAHVAHTILQALGQDYLIAGHRLHLSASIGISIFPGDGDDIDTLIKHADLAMYHVKAGGRNGFEFFSPQMNAQILERVALENQLRGALEQGQFVLEYQAQVDLASLSPLAAEALLRWRHPQQGLLLPQDFMAVAEDAGLMLPIGDWVLTQACQQAAHWRASGQPLVVAVNLSRTEFLQKNLVDKVAAALAAARLPPALLELELTEAILMQHDGVAAATLDGLRALGVRLALDDFGTGYTRVGQLRDYPLDKLKIDTSFVSGVGGEGAAAVHVPVVNAIIAFAHKLGLAVLAEGVENHGQFDFLRRNGCDQYQGRYARASGQLDGLSGLLD